MPNEEPLSVRLLNELQSERGAKLRHKIRAVGPVLLVEDDPNDSLIVEIVFQSLGLSLVSVSNGDDALALLRSKDKAKPFALVLLDLRLKGMSGVDVLRTVQQEQPDLHVVILTAALSHDMIDVSDLSYFGVAFKPLQKPDVMAILLKHGLIRVP